MMLSRYPYMRSAFFPFARPQPTGFMPGIMSPLTQAVRTIRPPRFGIDRDFYGDGVLAALGAVGKAILSPVVSVARKLIPAHTVVGKMIGATRQVGTKLAGPAVVGLAAGAVGQALVPTSSGAPAVQAPGLPAVPGAAEAAGVGVGTAIGRAITGAIPWWKGPGGGLQMPWADPATMKGLKEPFVLDDAYLIPTYRAPRGYVVVRDANGKPYPMWKPLARSMGLWRAARKPPISAGDWNKYQTAQTVEKKLRKIAGRALRRRSLRVISGSSRATATARVRRAA